ncbi:hypothetical protein pdam_00024284, partial [Pocillopora damicornis]
MVRSRGDYCLDDTTTNICAKRSTRHPSLLPGVFLVHCKHGITYGFSVILCNESSNIPFTVFRMRFPQEWKIRSVSCKKKILFHLSITQKKVFSSLEDVLFGKIVQVVSTVMNGIEMNENENHTGKVVQE